ncbi:MAG: hypothetical protein R3C59_21775 [Planctomycetaceae bacterium]
MLFVHRKSLPFAAPGWSPGARTPFANDISTIFSQLGCQEEHDNSDNNNLPVWQFLQSPRSIGDQRNDAVLCMSALCAGHRSHRFMSKDSFGGLSPETG